jgi:leupaxin
VTRNRGEWAVCQFLLCARWPSDWFGLHGTVTAGCAACDKPITLHAQALLALGKQWHQDCFVCTECRCPLLGTFFEMSGVPYCTKDYQRKFDLTCAACGEVITDRHLVANNKKFHATCVKCSVCAQFFAAGAPQ